MAGERKRHPTKWQVYKWGRSYWVALPPLVYSYSPGTSVRLGYPEGYVFYEWEDACDAVRKRVRYTRLDTACG